MTEQNIHEKLQLFLQHRDEIPLFYVESGSRLWNFASPDSDFKVLSLRSPRIIKNLYEIFAIVSFRPEKFV